MKHFFYIKNLVLVIGVFILSVRCAEEPWHEAAFEHSPVGPLSKSLLLRTLPVCEAPNTSLYVDDALLGLTDDCLKTATSSKKPILIITTGCIVTALSAFLAVLIYIWSMKFEAHATPVVRVPRKKKYKTAIVITASKRISLVVALFASIVVVDFAAFCLFTEGSRFGSLSNDMFTTLINTLRGLKEITNSVMGKTREILYQTNRLMEKVLKLASFSSLQMIRDFSQICTNLSQTGLHFAKSIDNEIRYLKNTALYSSTQIKLLLNLTQQTLSTLEEFHEMISFNKTYATDRIEMELFEKIELHTRNIYSLINITPYVDELLENLEVEISHFDTFAGTTFSAAVKLTDWSIYNISFGPETATLVEMTELSNLAAELTSTMQIEAYRFKHYMKRLFPESELSAMIQKIEQRRKYTSKIFSVIHLIASSIAILAVSLLFPIVVGAVIGLIATDCFGIRRKSTYCLGMLSNSGGNIMESASYITSIFIWIFWTLSILIFLGCVLPVHVCKSLQTLDALDIPVTLFIEHERHLFEDKYPTVSLRDVLVQCRAGADVNDIFNVYNSTKTLKDKRDFHFMKMRSTELREMVENLVSRIILIDLQPLNDHVESFKNNISPILERNSNLISDIYSILRSLYVHVTAVRNYTETHPLITHLPESSLSKFETSHLLASAIAFLFSRIVNIVDNYAAELLRIKNWHCENFFKLFDEFSRVSNQLNTFIEFNATTYMLEKLTSIANTTLQGMFYSVKYAFENPDSDNSSCDLYRTLYLRLANFFCDNFLSSLGTIWMSVVLISLFSFITVILSVPVCSLFKLPTIRDSKEKKNKSNTLLDGDYNYQSRRRATFNVTNEKSLPKSASDMKRVTWSKVEHTSPESQNDLPQSTMLLLARNA